MLLSEQVWTPAQRDRAIEALRAVPVQTPCRLCLAFQDGWCTQWKQAVPEAAQRDGCAEWTEAVPF